MTDEKKTEQAFQKILISRHSPQNECFADEGDILYAPPPEAGRKLRTGTRYCFRSVRDPSKTSKFGWVHSIDQPLSASGFATRHLPGQVAEEQLRVLSELLSTISELPDDTPVAGSYFLRGVENRHLELGFHKVFFYRENSSAARLAAYPEDE